MDIDNDAAESENALMGFIILRHVNSEATNRYWIHCHECIRRFYPENPILIIDDNSNYSFITISNNEIMYKTRIIQSEFPKRGELLPYYYYLRNPFAKYVVILHDSVFINKYIDFLPSQEPSSSHPPYRFLWDFEHEWDQIEDETRMIQHVGDPDLLTFYEDKVLWKGCFGGMCLIRHDFLRIVDSKYEFTTKLLNDITERYNRCSFERVLACILQKEEANIPLFGNLHAYMPWGVSFENRQRFYHLPIIKVWTGR